MLEDPQHTRTTYNQNNQGLIGHGSHNNVGCNNITNITQVKQTGTHTEEADAELDRLFGGSISEDALCNTLHSPPECHPGTRKTVRKEIEDWFNGRSSTKSPLLWLHGAAGVGKSVIAKTIARSHRDQVVCTFFFSTSSDRNAATVFSTLSWQLARKIPATKKHIIASLKNNGSLLTSELQEQFDHLIVQPLKKCAMTYTSLPVMIIDGVDECTDEYMLSQFLQVLVAAAESGDMPLRFIICSRPEARIRAIFEEKKDNEDGTRQSHVFHSQPRHYWESRNWIQFLLPDVRNRFYVPLIWGFRNPSLLLQDVWTLYRPIQLGDTTKEALHPEMHDNSFDRIFPHHDPVVSSIQIGFSEECREDIARYLRDKLDATGCRMAESDISQLVDRSCGQFLYASIIVRLLDDYHPDDVLEMARYSALPTPDLNKLYTAILKRALDAIRNHDQEGGPDYATELRALMDTLGILVVLAENVHFFNIPNNFGAISSLTGIEKSRLAKRLCKMHSILNVIPGKSISVHHRSFLEFLRSRKRSGEYYIAYTKALWRFLVLLYQAGFRYFIMDWLGKLRDEDRRIREDVENIALACRRNYFKRSNSPVTLTSFHDLIHYALPCICLALFGRCIGIPPTLSAFILGYLFLAFFCLLVSFGSFLISLTIYTLTLTFNEFLILPLFHPFLHLHFVTTVGILLDSQQNSSPTSQTLFAQFNEARLRVLENFNKMRELEELACHLQAMSASKELDFTVFDREGKEVYRCDCGHETSTRRDMIRHVERIKHRRAFYACSDCDMPFMWKESLAHHIRSTGHSAKSTSLQTLS